MWGWLSVHAGGGVRLATSLKHGSQMRCVLVLRQWCRAPRRQRRKQKHPCYRWPLPRQVVSCHSQGYTWAPRCSGAWGGASRTDG